MKKGIILSVFRILAISTLFIKAAPGGANPHAYSVDWFLVEGNLPGFALDDFDDGDLTPWSIDQGTATESGGAITFTRPGKSDINRFDSYLVKFESSKVSLATSGFNIRDGAGDFVAISSWAPVVPAQNQMYRMHAKIETPFGVDLEVVSIGIVNAGPFLTGILGFSPGLNVIFENHFNGIDLAKPQLFPITKEEISDNILLILIFDDGTDLFSGAFSLDGGETFQRPFTPVHSQIGEGIFGDWELDAVFMDIRLTQEPSSQLHLPGPSNPLEITPDSGY